MNNTPIRVGYLNCRGLSATSFDTIASYIPTTFDIFFCSETWYQLPAYYASHPLFLCASPTPPPSATGRNHGGILCLISPSLRRHSSFSFTSFSIDVSIFHTSIRALYLPPSLPSSDYSSYFTTPTHSSTSSSALPDIFIGDVNVRLGSLTLDTVTRPAERKQVILDALSAGPYFLSLPSSGHSRNHHVITRPTTSFSWCYRDASFLTQTDHQLMDCTFVPHCQVDLGNDKEAFRINLKPLQHAAIRSELCACFDLCADEFSQYSKDQLAIVQYCSKAGLLDQFTLQERQDIVDYLDQCIVNAITSSAEEVCGTYKPSVMRATADQFWSSIPDAPSVSDAIRAFKRASRSKTVILTSRSPDVTPADDAVAHFTSVFSQSNPAFQAPDVSPYRGVSFDPEVDFDVFFKKEDLVHFWEKYPTHVAGGMDGIHVRLLRALSDSVMVDRLVELYHLCLLLGVTPASWNRSTIFPIPKRDDTTIDTFRPISLTLMLRRSFEKLLLKYLGHSPAFWLHPTQAGFRRGFSTLTHALVAHESAIMGYKYRVFFDFAQAYDTVPVPLLLQKLKERNASPQILALVDALFLGTSSTVVVNGQQTAAVPLERGLFQGSLLSPLLFDVFIDDLASLLDEDTDVQSRLPRGLLFADDITAGSNRLSDLQVSATKMSAWALQNGMKFNIGKCGLVGASPSDLEVILPGYGAIPIVESYTYLGFPYESTGINFETHLASVTAKAQRTLDICMRNSLRWTSGIRLAFYRTFVRSQLDYGAGLIYHWIMQGRPEASAMPFPRIAAIETSRFRLLIPLQTLQESALVWILEHNRSVLSHYLLAMPVITTRFSNLACLLTRHFSKMNARNPLVVLQHRLFHGLRTGDRVSPYCRKHHDMTQWRSVNRRCEAGTLRPIPPGLTADSRYYPLRLWLRNKFLDDIKNTGSVMAQYIVPSMRRRQTGACQSVFLQSRRLRKNAIAWHHNNFAQGSNCTVCKEKFHQVHVTRCYDAHLTNRLPAQVVQAYRNFVPPLGTPSNFGIVDFMLRFKHYSALSTCFGLLELWLRPRSNYAH